MTDETRNELRKGIEGVLRAVAVPDSSVTTDVTCRGHDVSVAVFTRMSYLVDLPPLTTAQQLALSVLLGEPVPLGVLLTACEDAGVFPNGVLEEVRRLAYEQGAKDADRLGNLVKAMTPVANAYGQAMTELGRSVARMLALPPAVADPHPSTPPTTG